MIATTISQSKHLLELGLSLDSADMSYSEEYFGKDKDGNDEWCWRLNACKFIDVEGIIPAWSVDAMQKLMPSRIIIDNRYYDFDWTKTEKTYIYVYANSLEYRHEITANENSNAAYVMLCWLLENNFIEKSK